MQVHASLVKFSYISQHSANMRYVPGAAENRKECHLSNLIATGKMISKFVGDGLPCPHNVFVNLLDAFHILWLAKLYHRLTNHLIRVMAQKISSPIIDHDQFIITVTQIECCRNIVENGLQSGLRLLQLRRCFLLFR